MKMRVTPARARSYILAFALAWMGVGEARAFTHPGIPLTVSDLDAIKANLNKEPWKSGFAALASDWRSQLSYTMQGPFTYVNRNNGGNYDHETAWKNDMQAIWNLSRMWYFTGNTDYAQKAHDILLAWANTMTTFGGIESGLDLGDYAFRYGGGADILRGTWPGWTEADTTTVSNFFKNVYLPATGVNSSAGVLGPSNKGALQMAGALACAVFCDDTTLFNQILYLYRTSASCGLHNNCLTSGEMGETGRDQGHAYADLLQMAFMAEVFWKQGVDVFSEDDNRLLACGEYWSRNNLNPAAAYITFGTTDEIYWNNSTGTAGNSAGGNFAAEPMAGNIVRGAYETRKGLPAPWTLLKRATQSENMESFCFLKPTDSSTATPPAAIIYPAVATATSGLTNVDIGSVGVAGSGSYSGGVWTVTGGGAETWTHSADSCHLVYKQLTGDCMVLAKVNSVSNTAGTAKAGVMIRSSLSSSAGSRAWMAITSSSTIESYNHGWTQCYGGSNWETFPRNGAGTRWVPSMPYWVRLERLGNTVSTYISLDGTSWEVCTVAVYDNMPATAYVGLFVCALNTSTACTGVFTNVSITGGTGGNVTTPPAPYAIYASPDAGRVPLRWLRSFGATSYNVKRSTASGGPYTTIASGVTNASYVDTSVAPSTTYYYAVTASNSAGTSANSPEDSATTQPPPAAPTGLSVSAGNAQATLLWIGSGGATSYRVKRSATNGSGYVTVATVSGASYTDTGLTNGVTYYYVVSAVSAAGESSDSSQAGVTPVASAPATLFWSGSVNGTWDTATANWSSGGAGATFQDGNAVIFDDTGSANPTINLSASRSPGGIVFNNASTNYTLGGSAIAGTGGLLKQGGGMLALNSANTYGGGTTIKTGTLTVGNSGALGTGAVTLNGGALNLNAMTLANNFVLPAGGSATIDNAAGNATLGGSFTGAGALTIQNSSGTNLSDFLNGGWSGFTGTLNYKTAGAVINIFASASMDLSHAAVSFANPGSLTISSFRTSSTGTTRFGSLAGFGYLDVNGATEIGNLGTDTTFSGIIRQTGTIAKVGSGTLTLTGANTYAGATTVNAGKLLISTASLASGNYSVANGATLGVVNASSASAPASTVTLSAGSTLEFQSVSSTTTPLIAASNVTVNGSCTVKIIGASGLFAGSTYPLVSYSGQLQGSFANLQVQLPSGVTATLVNNAHQIALSVTASPVPAAPGTLTATAGSGQVALSWSASTGAVSYNVKRATTSGGPYTTIANVSGTSYTDTTAANGTTYYYTVTAVNPNGESSNSAEIGKTPSDVLLHLKFDETSGTTAADSSGNGWDATTVNSPAWTAGTVGNAISLASTSSQYLTLPAGVVSTLNDYTISTWVKLNSVSNWARIFDFGTGTNVYMFLTPQSGATGKARFAITTGGTAGEQQIDSSTAITVGAWTHVAITLSGSTGSLYINGALVGANTGMTLMPSSLGSTTQNYIGKSQFSDPYLNGLVDDFRIYRRALSASEVAALVAGPPAAPQNVTATGGPSQIALFWDTANNATSYTIRRSSSSGGPYNVIASGIADTGYTDAALADGATWYYTVAAQGLAGEGAQSASVSATTYTTVESWRQANFGTIANSGNAADSADPDGDGLTNAQEFAAGTNPNDAASALRVSAILVSGNDLMVSFPTVAGKAYRLERSSTLQPGSWTTVQDNIAGTGGVVTIADVNAASQSNSFYRAVVP